MYVRNQTSHIEGIPGNAAELDRNPSIKLPGECFFFHPSPGIDSVHPAKKSCAIRAIEAGTLAVQHEREKGAARPGWLTASGTAVNRGSGREQGDTCEESEVQKEQLLHLPHSIYGMCIGHRTDSA